MKIGNDNYDIVEDWLVNIAGRYFNLTTEKDKVGKLSADTDLSLLKLGFFGYANDVMANSVKNAAYHRNILFNEGFLNTASMPESIYEHAKLYNFEIGRATPSTMQVAIALNIEDIETPAYYTTNDLELKLTLSRLDKILVGDFDFRLLKNITIIGRRNTNKENFMYTIVEENDNGTDNFVKFTINNGMIIITTVIYQFNITTNLTQIFTENATSRITVEAKYEDQLYDFLVYYAKDGVNFKKINKYFNNRFVPNDTEYCYYTYNNQSEIEVFFPASTDAFRPLFNSKIKVEVMSTKGKEGNFEFGGEIVYSSDLYNNLDVIVQSMDDAKGGSDQPTLKQTKNDIINKVLTRDNLVTEYDLNTFFNKILASSTNSTIIKFLRRRDDLLYRMFNAFLLMRNKNDVIIPTNTIDIEIENTDINNEDINFISITPQSYIGYNKNKNIYTVISKEEIDDYEKDGHVYRLPFNLDVYINRESEQPIPLTRVINFSMKKSYSTILNSINPKVAYNFNITDFSIERDPLCNGEYKDEFAVTSPEEYRIEVTIKTNMEKAYMLGDLGNYIHRQVKLFMVLKNPKNKEPMAYIELEPDVDNSTESGYYYKGKLRTDDVLDKDLNILMDNIRPIGSTSPSNNTCNIPLNIIPELFIVMSNTDGNTTLLSSLKDYKDKHKQDPIYELGNSSTVACSFLLKNNDNLLCLGKNIENMCNIPVNPIIKWNDDTIDIHEKGVGIKNPVIINTIKEGIELPNSGDLIKVQNKQHRVIKVTEGNEYMLYDLYYKTHKLPLSNGLNGDTIISTDSISLSGVPVIGYKFYSDFKDYNQVNELLSKYIDLLETSFNKLENNTTFNLKFYNTYGKSKFFNTGKTNIGMKLRIKLKTTHTNELDYGIKIFILKFIEGTNRKKVFPLSNLITSLEKGFPEIEYVECDGFCDGSIIKIENKVPDTNILNKKDLKSFIPEYVNVEMEKTDYTDNVKQIINSAIDITYLN